jgi:hypothetical protein
MKVMCPCCDQPDVEQGEFVYSTVINCPACQQNNCWKLEAADQIVHLKERIKDLLNSATTCSHGRPKREELEELQGELDCLLYRFKEIGE